MMGHNETMVIRGKVDQTTPFWQDVDVPEVLLYFSYYVAPFRD